MLYEIGTTTFRRPVDYSVSTEHQPLYLYHITYININTSIIRSLYLCDNILFCTSINWQNLTLFRYD